MVIDDEESITILVERILSNLGYKVTTYTSSVNALQAIKDSPYSFDLVITDQTMPGYTGTVLAQKILKIRPDIPIILATGFGEAISVDEALSFGIKEFVFKPFVKMEIAKMIRSLLDKKEELAQV